MIGALTAPLLGLSLRALRLLRADPSRVAGLAPALGVTLRITALTVCFALPLGVAVAMWRTRLSRSRRLASTLGFAIEALATLPGVVYGVAGALVLMAMGVSARGWFSGAVVLAAMSVPVATVQAEEALGRVSRELETASTALGASTGHTFLSVTLPEAARGLAAAALAIASRAMAAGAPLVFTAGLEGPARALSVTIWQGWVHPSPGSRETATLAAVLLLAMTSVTRLVAERLRRV